MPSEDRIVQNAPDSVVAAGVRLAVAKLMKVDALLFQSDANERSITHRLALHMTSEFPDWDVDCEYNRKGLDQKKVIYSIENDREPTDTNGSRVFPDIIVHHRSSSENLLVIEIKKSTSKRSDDADLQKLKLLKGQLGYRVALFIRFLCGASEPAVERIKWL